MGRLIMNVPNQRRHRKPVVNYETIYRKYQKLFKRAGLLSMAFLVLLFVAIDQAVTNWLTAGKVDIKVILFIGLFIVCVIGLIDKLPAMVRAHMASREQNILMVLNCKKILESHREQLASVGYDIVSLDRLSEQGIAPQELERIVRDVLATRAAQKSQPKVSSQRSPEKNSHVSEPRPAKSLESQKDSILLSLREREHEIKTRVRKNTLSKPEANVLIESARREAKKRLHELGISEV